MDKVQRATLDSYDRITDFNTKYEVAVAATIAEYALEQGKFDGAVTGIKTAVSLQEQPAGAQSTLAKSLRQSACDAVNKYALRGMVKARQLGNTVLADELDQPVTFMKNTSKSKTVLRCKNQRDLLNGNLATLTNITTANITEIDSAIAAYDSSKNEAVETIQVKKADGTDLLPGLYETADDAAGDMYSLIFSYFNDVNVGMVGEMQLAMEIINTGIRHTIIDFTVLADEDGSALEGGTVTDTSNNNVVTTDENGLGHFGTHRNGHFTFIVAAAGRTSVSFSATIAQGKTNAFTVRLKKS
jgi:hypothetical protein